jgi:hypothetical protein
LFLAASILLILKSIISIKNLAQLLHYKGGVGDMTNFAKTLKSLLTYELSPPANRLTEMQPKGHDSFIQGHLAVINALSTSKGVSKGRSGCQMAWQNGRKTGGERGHLVNTTYCHS